MNVFFYCQHILGMGHFFRSLEIIKALKSHHVTLITGGPSVDTPLPRHVTEFRLPGLVSDPEFNGLTPLEKGRSLLDVQKERARLLFEKFEEDAPDLFIIELFPFGRNAFRFELGPILDGIRKGDLSPCRVVCSLRDVLVEKKDPDSYCDRVIGHLDKGFDALLVHGDPDLIGLDQTFPRFDDISTQTVYTGLIAGRPAKGAGPRLRKKMALPENRTMIVASAGGGKVGFELLEATVQAVGLLPQSAQTKLFVFTGPYMDEGKVDRLRDMAGPDTIIERFTSDFPSYLAAADLSVSMAGYNTCLNVAAAKTFGLVFPFDQNREQRLRADALAGKGLMRVLEAEDLQPKKLAGIMDECLRIKPPAKISVNLKGAEFTAKWLEDWMQKPWRPVTSFDHSSLWEKLPDDPAERLEAAVARGLERAPEHRADVFFRADDVGVPGKAFTRLIRAFQKFDAPLCLAVTPAWLTKGRWKALTDLTGKGDQWCWHQHGWRHVNHEDFGKKWEFGPSRSDEAIISDLTRGRDRLQGIMGNRFSPIFTPPWNRCDERTLAALKQAGFSAISRSRGAKPPSEENLPDFPINSDLHTRREILAETARNRLLDEIENGLAAGQLGVMIHHQLMNEPAAIFLEQLLSIVISKHELNVKHFNGLMV